MTRIASVLRRCAEHENERLRGATVFPKTVMVEIAVEAEHWASYLEQARALVDHPAKSSEASELPQLRPVRS